MAKTREEIHYNNLEILKNSNAECEFEESEKRYYIPNDMGYYECRRIHTMMCYSTNDLNDRSSWTRTYYAEYDEDGNTINEKSSMVMPEIKPEYTYEVIATNEAGFETEVVSYIDGKLYRRAVFEYPDPEYYWDSFSTTYDANGVVVATNKVYDDREVEYVAYDDGKPARRIEREYDMDSRLRLKENMYKIGEADREGVCGAEIPVIRIVFKDKYDRLIGKIENLVLYDANGCEAIRSDGSSIAVEADDEKVVYVTPNGYDYKDNYELVMDYEVVICEAF